MSVEPKTIMTVRVDYPIALAGAPFKEWTITEGAWDLSMSDFYDMCEDMALAMGYHEETVRKYFNDVSPEYETSLQ